MTIAIAWVAGVGAAVILALVGAVGSPRVAGLDEQAQRDLAILIVTVAIGVGCMVAARHMRGRR